MKSSSKAKKIIATFMEEESGKASNQKLELLLGMDGINILPKNIYGYLIEAEDGKLCKYPFTATFGTKELIIDYGEALSDDPKETPSKPLGFRYAKLTIVKDIAIDEMLTLTAGEDRNNYKIISISDAY